MIVTTRGMVLRAAPFKEHDRILTLLTEDLGRITVIANAVRSVRSHNKSAVLPYSFSEYTLYKKGDLYHLRGSDVILSPVKPGASLETLALCAYFSQLCEDACADAESCRDLLRFLLNGICIAAKEDRSLSLIKGVFELRFLTLIGYMPDLFCCADCGSEQTAVFDLPNGHVRCASCAAESPREGERVVSDACFALARRAVTVGEKEAYAVKADEKLFFEFSSLCEQYLLTQMGRDYTSLRYYHEINSTRIEKNV